MNTFEYDRVTVEGSQMAMKGIIAFFKKLKNIKSVRK